MKRISIQWHKDTILESLLIGTVTILEGETPDDMTLSISFQIEIDKYSISMKGVNGKDLPRLSNEQRDVIHTMAECYRDGLAHAHSVFCWTQL